MQSDKPLDLLVSESFIISAWGELGGQAARERRNILNTWESSDP